MTATELNIVNYAGRELIFSNFILDNSDRLQEYDYILIDTNPNLGMINQNVFNAADKIVLVSDVSFNSITGAEFFIALWMSIWQRLRKTDNVAALLLNNSDSRMKLPRELIGYINSKEDLRHLLLQNTLPASIQVKNGVEHLAAARFVCRCNGKLPLDVDSENPLPPRPQGRDSQP